MADEKLANFQTALAAHGKGDGLVWELAQELEKLGGELHADVEAVLAHMRSLLSPVTARGEPAQAATAESESAAAGALGTGALPPAAPSKD